MSSSPFALPSDGDLVAAFHAIPRYDAALERASATFALPADGAGAASSTYLQGVLLQAGGVWALAAIFLLVFGLTFAAACCCRKRLPADDADASAYARGVGCCSGRACYFFTALAFAGGLAAAMAYTGTFFAGVGNLLTGLVSFRDYLVAQSSNVNGPLLGNLTGLSSLAQQVATDTAGGPYEADANALASSAASAAAFAASLGAQLNSTASLLTGDFALAFDAASAGAAASVAAVTVPSKIELGALRYGLSYGSWALLATVVAWMLMHAAMLAATPCAARLFKACSVLTLVSAVLVTVLLGLVYIPALMGADVCAAPAQAVASVLNASSADALAADTFNFYSQCAVANAAGSPLAPAGAYADALDSQVQLESASAQLAGFVAVAGGDPTLGPLLASMVVSLAGANASLALLLVAVQCAPLASTWATVLSGLCGGAVFGMAAMTCCLACGVVLLFILLIATAHVMLHHPGDLSADAQEQKAAASAPPSSLERALRSISAADTHIAQPAYMAPAAAASRVAGATRGASPQLYQPPPAGVARSAGFVADYR